MLCSMKKKEILNTLKLGWSNYAEKKLTKNEEKLII